MSKLTTDTQSIRQPDPLALAQGEASRITLIGLALDLVLCAVKIGGGLLFASFALIADGVHSLTDAATDLFVLAIARTAYAPADTGHPYGHGRFEALGTGVMGVIFFATSGLLLWDSWQRFAAIETAQLPGLYGAGIAAVSIAGKEWIFRYTLAASHRLNSSLLKANAWHSRSDALSSIAVFIGVVFASQGIVWMDLAAAMLVALMIARIGWSLCRESVDELVDRALPPQRHTEIVSLLSACSGVRGVSVLRSRLSGGRALVEAHLLVEPKISVSEGHHIGEQAAAALRREQADIREVLIHIDPDEESRAPAQTVGVLPSREVVEQVLSAHWHSLGNDGPPPQFTLHYLDSGLDIDLLSDEAEGSEKLSRLSAKLSEEPWLHTLQILRRESSKD